jgi:hypothetical protein
MIDVFYFGGINPWFIATGVSIIASLFVNIILYGLGVGMFGKIRLTITAAITAICFAVITYPWVGLVVAALWLIWASFQLRGTVQKTHNGIKGVASTLGKIRKYFAKNTPVAGAATSEGLGARLRKFFEEALKELEETEPVITEPVGPEPVVTTDGSGRVAIPLGPSSLQDESEEFYWG